MPDPSTPQDSAIIPKFKIGAVTRMTGLSADVVRVWERRYRVIAPARSRGGTRLYSEADVSRLKQLRLASAQGHPIGRLAALTGGELEQLIDGHAGVAGGKARDPYAAVRERFLEAIGRMDDTTADLELSRAAALYSAQSLVKKIVAPLIEEIGELWAHRRYGVAHEHLATNLVRSLLYSLLRLYPRPEAASAIVLATLSGERHELGLLQVALLAAARNWRVVYLGTDLPADEIARAVQVTRAGVLGISLAAPPDAQIKRELKALAAGLHKTIRVWVGGGRAPEYGQLIERERWTLIRDLDDLDARLTR